MYDCGGPPLEQERFTNDKKPYPPADGTLYAPNVHGIFNELGLTHGFEALAECHQLVNNHTKLNGIDGFSSSSFK